MATTPEAGLERSARVGNLAIALSQRWRRDGALADRSDLDRAISLTETSPALMENGNPERATRLVSLSGFLRWRHDHGSNPADLEAALRVASEALAGTADGHPNRATRLAGLANLLEVRGTPADQIRSIALHRDAWALVTGTAGFAGFAVVGIGNDLASAIRNLRSKIDPPALTPRSGQAMSPTDQGDADRIGNELLTVLSVTLDALDAYLARLPVDAEADALFAVGTYGHLYGWLIDETATAAQATIDAGLPADDLLRATFTAIERSKGRRLASRLQTGKLQPTPETLPLGDALERLKPELDRLETILFSGGTSAPLLGPQVSPRTAKRTLQQPRLLPSSDGCKSANGARRRECNSPARKDRVPWVKETWPMQTLPGLRPGTGQSRPNLQNCFTRSSDQAETMQRPVGTQPHGRLRKSRMHCRQMGCSSCSHPLKPAPW